MSGQPHSSTAPGGERSKSLEAEAKPVNTRSLAEELTTVMDEVQGVKQKLAVLADSLEGVKASLSKLLEEISSNNMFMYVAKMVGEWKRLTCKYHREGLCLMWRISREAAIGLCEDCVEEIEGALRLRVVAMPYFCSLCPLYEPAEK